MGYFKVYGQCYGRGHVVLSVFHIYFDSFCLMSLSCFDSSCSYAVFYLIYFLWVLKDLF